jgi:hypothetical protein
MPLSRARSAADVRHELHATEQRLLALIARWQSGSTSAQLANDAPPSRELLEQAEEVLRQQRGAIDRLHQLWIELAQLSGHHAPQ